MKLVFICQAVDLDDPILATTVRWINVLANSPQVDQVSVIPLRRGRFAFPQNVLVEPAIKGKNRLDTLIRFYKAVIRQWRDGVDCFFIYMGGPYPALLLPFKVLGKAIYQWKAHPHISPTMNFYARYCVTKLFTSTEHAFPLRLPNRVIVGQGVDTHLFMIKQKAKCKDLITVGRISQSKRLDVMLKALAYCNDYYGTSYRLDIYGPISETNVSYQQRLSRLVAELNLTNLVSFCGAVPHDQLPDVLSQYRLYLNFSDTALDRAVVEAMACGLSVLSTNPCVADILSSNLRGELIVPANDLQKQAKHIYHILNMSQSQLTVVGRALREIVVKNHNLDRLFEKILAEIEVCV